jgi:hopanoid biosynthesis associated RND transporter like protein HpnN
MGSTILERVVGFCIRHPIALVLLCALAAAAAGDYASQNFKMNSDSAALISANTPWRQRDAIFDSKFPQTQNLTLVVVDGKTPEIADQAAQALEAKLRSQKDLFPIVRDQQGDPFFRKNGLLFLSLDEVKDTTQQMIDAQPFLGPLAADPSLRGIMTSLSTALLGVTNGDATLEDLKRPLTAFGDALGSVAAGKKTFFSWQTLINDKQPDLSQTRRLIQVKGALDYSDLMPGARASAQIRKDARELGLTPENGVRVRLTGPVPLADEEFATLTQNAGLMVTLMVVAITLMLWLAVRSLKIILSILATLAVGLVSTAAIGLFAVGTFNVISVAFIPLFVSIGVDFGIQFSVRYRAERHALGDLDKALVEAGRSIGVSLTLAAVAIAVAFYAFLPTDYAGVAELGLIAGTGIIIGYLFSLTLLPALLKLVHPKGEPAEIGYTWLAPLERFLVKRNWLVFLGFGLLAIGSLALLPRLTFDFNPLHLRSVKAESVSTLFDLMKNPDTSPNTIDVLEPTLEKADRMAEKLSALPETGQVITLSSFIPDNQQAKLALVSDADLLLDPTLNPFVVEPAPSDGEVVASLTKTAKDLREAAAGKTGHAAETALRLAGTLEKLAAGPASLRTEAYDTLIPPLKTELAQMRDLLQASPVTLRNLPDDLVRDWVARDYTARVQVFPSSSSDSNAALTKFSDAVLKVAPDATGEPISIQESGRTIVRAFTEAGALSFVAILVLLGIVLRRVGDVFLTVLPLVLAGLFTLATCVAIGLNLNFANIIAFPLLFGIGVAFNIYYVMAWRSGAREFLQSSLARAVFFSALTTGTGFGTLWISAHPGTASLGELLMISLGWTLVMAQIFLPALLGTVKAR